MIIRLIIPLALLIFGCKPAPETTNKSTDTPIDQESDWQYLFDGSSTDGWRAYNGDKLPPQWIIKDGCLTFDTQLKLEADHTGGKDIIYGGEEYENFELYLEWKLPKGGNTGIFYHLVEGKHPPYEVAPEYQLLDDLGWEEINNQKLEEWQKCGADYGMYTPDLSQKILHPAGQWNSSQIKFTPDRVEYYLNDKLILSFVPWSPDWHTKKSESKWKDVPTYGKNKKGYIGLQDHDSPLWFRNIKIKKL